MRSNKSNGQLTAQINLGDYKKSGFDLSNNVLGTGKIGRIIPTRALHVMPNDTIKADSKVAVQFEPLAVPILANMDVKQEHFYCPYNIVWKNWDKFISGGEKMDFKGVVPNTSMRKIAEVVRNRFPQFFVPIIKNNNGNLYINGDEYADNTFFIDMHDHIDTIGDDYSIRDLLKPQHETIELIKNYYLSIYDNAGPAFIKVTTSAALTETLNSADCNSKYIQEIAPSFYELLDFHKTLYVPTNEAVILLQMYYEFYKPFFGIGSNLDYLNMGRITFADYLYIMTECAWQRCQAVGTTFKLDLYTPIFADKPISVLNLRANYNVWYNNYRDILLESDAFEPVDTDAITEDELFVMLVPRQRCWEKDAFTTALDTPGTGNVGVPVSLVQELSNVGYNSKAQSVDNAESLRDGNNVYEVSIGSESWKLPTSFLTGINPQIETSVQIDTAGFSLYQLDAAQRAQKWLQKALYYGNRISDFYYMHFGVRFLDARLRLPELLTSSSELVKLDVVMNNTNITTEANGEIYQSIAGDRAAYASAYDNGNSFERYCEEHGVILSYLTIMPQATYAYGMSRDYSRLDQFDFAFSEFATLGMDAVYDSEITSISVDLPGYAQDVRVFGYQGKYYDYKAKHSEEHGELLDSQDMYTFARKFNMYDPNGRPKLNYEFVHCFPDLDMFVVNSTLSDYFRYDIRHSTAAERNLPSQSIYI